MDKKIVMDLLYHMLLIRRFEEKAAEMYSRGKIGGFLHLAVGMEASCVGAISTLRADDYVIGRYREHGHYLAKGGDPSRAMAELFGRIDGMSKGKGGSMHFFDKERNFLGGTGIVGGQFPIGTGAGLAINYNGGDKVCLVFFGDGSVAQGVFHESLNLPSLWRLPVIYICENNLYAMGTALNRTQAITDLYKKADGYGMPGEQVDGMDVLAVRETVGRAVDRARREKIPTLIESRTYRFRGHSMRDPAAAVYRTREVVYAVAIENDNVWAATTAGASRFNTITGEWTIYTEKNAPMEEIWNYYVAARDGKVHLAVWGSGILEFDVKTENWKVYLDPDGEMEIDLYRDDGNVHVIVTGASYVEKVLWVSSYFGCARYDGRHWRGYFDHDCGLPSNFNNNLKARSVRGVVLHG